ncbi:hypothetical protein [Planotetraspora sp. GP83]|uniref:hypothetical protein n=1 Tax=Planotetraspora sp. GP83 TaxID=3156264 RepID=UPI0035126FE4
MSRPHTDAPSSSPLSPHGQAAPGRSADVPWWADVELLDEAAASEFDFTELTDEPDDPLDGAPPWLIAEVEAAGAAAEGDHAADTPVADTPVADTSGVPPLQLYGEPFAEVAGVAPGALAAAGIERALPRLSTLPDSHVLDVLAAARRMASWAEAVQLSAAVELHGRPVRDQAGEVLAASRDLVELTQACVVEEMR